MNHAILHWLAFGCFALATINVKAPVNLVALGLALAALTVLV